MVGRSEGAQRKSFAVSLSNREPPFDKLRVNGV